MPRTPSREPATESEPLAGAKVDPAVLERVHVAVESVEEALAALRKAGLPVDDFAATLSKAIRPLDVVEAMSRMLRSVEALGPALSDIPVDTSPPLARSMQATENAWRRMDHEFGLLSSLEVSERVGSRKPNRSYASDQHGKGRLIAVMRPGGLRYPGFQIDPHEQRIRPLMEDLLGIAREAGISETSLALWMCSPTGYLDGARPVDRLDHPEAVAEAARHAFTVEW